MNSLDIIQSKIETLEKLSQVKAALATFYPYMDLTDFEHAIYSLEDDLAEDDDK